MKFLSFLCTIIFVVLFPFVALADVTTQFATQLGVYTTFPGGVAATRVSIQTNTDDGTDSASLCLSGGGGSVSSSCASTRGGSLVLYGNEEGSAPGGVQFRTGNLSGATAYIDLTNSASAFELRDSSNADIFKVLSGGALAMPQVGASNKGLVMGFASMPGDASTATGLYVFGNASSAPNEALASGVNSTSPAILRFLKSRATDGSADVIVQSGDSISQISYEGANGTTFSTAAQILVTVDGTPGAAADMPGAIDFKTSPDGSATPASVLKLSNDKSALFTGTVRSSATADIGWSVQAVSNQACNTTCTSACVFGFNLTAGVPGTLLACTDATADVCLCAGAT